MVSGEVAASVNQRLMWLMDHYRGQAGAFGQPLFLRLRGPLDRAALQEAVDRLVDHHEALRTTMARRGRELVLAVHDRLPVEIEDRPAPAGGGTGAPGGDREAAVRQAVADGLRAAPDAAECPVRALLWRLAPGDHVLCLGVHHLATDDWSQGLIGRHLGEVYSSLCGGPPAAGGWDDAWPYSRWVRWQRELLSGESLERHRRYWTEHLQGARFPELDGAGPDGAPCDPAPAPGAGQDASRRLRAVAAVPFDPEAAEAIRAAGRAQRATPFPLLLAAFYALLHERTGQRDLAVATLFANRTLPEVQATVGFFVNMIVLRARVGPDATYDELVATTRRHVLKALRYQGLPFQLLPPGVSGSARGRADDVMFQVLEPWPSPVWLHGLEVTEIEPAMSGSRFALELVVAPRPGGLTALLMYDERRFPHAWSQRLLHDYVALTAALARRPDAPLSTMTGGPAAPHDAQRGAPR